MLAKVFEPFIEASPVSVMARGLAERLLDARALDAWFESVDTVQYTRELPFSAVFSLMSQVVCGSQKSVNAAYQAAKDEVPTSITSVYNKLQGIEVETSAALVRYAAAEATALIHDLDEAELSTLPGYRVKLLDGNCLAASEHRLKELRDIGAGPLPGKSLVVYDQALRLPVDMFPCEDGHTQERALLGEVLDTVDPMDVWVADRNFCTVGFLTGIAKAGGYFVIREHKNLPWEPAADSELAAAGKVDTGTVHQRWVQLVDEAGETLQMRRVTLRLKKATRDGDREIHILTNLPEESASAAQIAELYRDRWTIETTFQELTVNLNCEVNTLGYPRAALFGFSVALVAYIIMAVLRAALRSVHGGENIDENFSGYYLADELSGVYRGMMISIPERHWVAFVRLGQAELIELLRALANKVNLSRFQKHRRGPKKATKKRKANKRTPHVSTAKIIAGRKK